MPINTKYLLYALLFFAVELIIALFIKDNFIRPFFGDFLAVIFVYAGLRIIWSSVYNSALLSLLIAYFIEVLQYFKFIEIMGLIKYKVLAILIGNSFSWLDILAYTFGFIFILLAENFEILGLFIKLQLESSKK